MGTAPQFLAEQRVLRPGGQYLRSASQQVGSLGKMTPGLTGYWGPVNPTGECPYPPPPHYYSCALSCYLIPPFGQVLPRRVQGPGKFMAYRGKREKQ